MEVNTSAADHNPRIAGEDSHFVRFLFFWFRKFFLKLPTCIPQNKTKATKAVAIVIFKLAKRQLLMTRHFQWFGMTGIPLLWSRFILSLQKSKHLLTQNKCLADQLRLFCLLSLGFLLSFFERHVLTTYCQTLSKKTFHPIRYHSTSIPTLPLLLKPTPLSTVAKQRCPFKNSTCLSKCYLLLPLVKINSFLSSSPRCSFFVSHL